MRSVRRSDTGPELMVRRLIHGLGLRFRLHRKDLPGTPDLVLPRHRIVVFVHGCFWHRHQGCPKATTPKTRADFWRKKFRQNVERDQRNEDALVAGGWQVVTVWECETLDLPALRDRLCAIFAADTDEDSTQTRA